MKTNRMCAIIGNEHEYADLLPLTAERPLSTLYFDCKYRILDFALSSVANANIRSVFMIVNEGRIKSIFDHLGGGREWGLDSIGSYQYISFYQDFVHKKAQGQPCFGDIIQFLKTSKSPYTVYLTNKFICNLDLQAVLKIHQEQNNEITAVFKRMPADKIAPDDQVLKLKDSSQIADVVAYRDVTAKKEIYNLSLGAFIMKTSWLIASLENSQALSIEEFLFNKLKHAKNSTYEYTGYVSNVYDLPSYYQANMDMLNVENYNSLLFSSQKVITRTKNEVATYFASESDVKNSQIATGCRIEGTVYNSLISRRTLIAKKAKVEQAIIMGSSSVSEKAKVKYAIIDKNVKIDPHVEIIGRPDNLVVIKKNSHITESVYGGKKK
ncbi:glucose-1-phosphate adenylyltransferase subunit GlgD [Liquorilactobacillus sicerae]|uniref:glucose-1-phosphate adenylyltransferase subunit GlgD n=1 Tax=Liquorilactobacillus sicerae TaxID=1416943 RepID=UPI002481842D|nr:glucose-1-phosphate adenylyltransferase subunit GlgD [Liquorilactobacillus sicerae]